MPKINKRVRLRLTIKTQAWSPQHRRDNTRHQHAVCAAHDLPIWVLGVIALRLRRFQRPSMFFTAISADRLSPDARELWNSTVRFILARNSLQ